MVQDILYKKDVLALEACQRQDGTVPVLSLYFDVLLPMTSAVSETDFVQGERSGTYGIKPGTGNGDTQSNMAVARKLLWKELHGYRLRACAIENGKIHYLTDLASEHKKLMLRCPIAMENDGLTWSATVQADIKPEVQLGEDVTVVNSVLKGEVTVGSKSVICHSLLSGSITVGKESLISGVSIDHLKLKKPMQFAESMVVQGFNICLKTLGTTRQVLTVHGRHDNIRAPTWKSMSTFCNEPWLVFLNRTGILQEDLWGTDVDADEQTVLQAKLFPVFHATEYVGLKEILWLQGKLADTEAKSFLNRPVIRLVLVGNGEVSSTVVCRELSDMEDYYQPHAPGALLKAAFVCCDMIDVNSTRSLRDQLMTDYASGFEMQSWSNLPHGSAAGKTYDTKGLIHAVLYLEQLLTTGGGWQDQIGGLMGGVHLGLSEAKLPLFVEPVDLKVSEKRIEDFNSRLLLIYTGKTRLARNLLQDVVRNWYARNPHIVSTEDSLVMLAQECAHAFIDGNFDKVGNCVGRYWQMKKRMAPGCESQTILSIMTALKPYMLGMCSAGAGGGGFIYGILRDASMRKEAVEVLGRQTGLEEAVVYEATVDTTGLTVTVEP
nr:hypothetical protein BaRGS_018740 [Batillaria attramentaria]